MKASAAISVGPTGTGVLTFSALPPNTEWSSRHVLPNSGTAITTVEGLDGPVQTNSAAQINTALANVNNGAANNNASWHSASQLIYTRPTGNSYQLLMGQFVNNIGDVANQITVSFDASIITPLAGQAAGWRVFYSLSGLPNEWVVIPELSGTEFNGSVGPVTVNLAQNWLSGTTLYLLFADDNADGITDPGYGIDNFQLTASPVNITPVSITTPLANATAPERGSATFTVTASGAPQFYHWSKNGTPIPGANGPSYTANSVTYPGDNGAQITVIVSNSLNSVSSTATLTVTPDTVPPTAIDAVLSNDLSTVIVTFSEPMNPNLPGSFGVFPTGTDPNNAAFPDQSVITGSNAVLTYNTPLAAGQNYSVVIYDVFDTAGANPPGNIIDPYPTIIPIRSRLELIGFDANNIWKYGTETNLFETGWETIGYDDSAWPTGEAALGRDTSANGVPIRTGGVDLPPYPISDSRPTFFRRQFYLPAAVSDVSTFTMRHVFEDGAVVYINGREAGRYNVAAGALSVTTRAIGTAADPTPISAPITLSTTNLVAGNNVIAVVVIQAGGASTDSVMALELIAIIDEFAAGPPVIETDPQSQTVPEGANVTLSVAAKGALPLTYQWRKGGGNLTGETNAFFSIQGVLPSDQGNYDVVVQNSLNTAFSAVATLTVTADNTAPVFQSAVGSTNLTNITLTIYDAYGLNQTLAENEGNYTVQLAAGGGALTIESAVLINSSNVVLTTSPRTQSQDYTVTLSNIRDTSAAANLVTPLTRPLLGGIVVLAPNDTTLWRFDNSSNNLDGLGWELPAFNDGGWQTGLAGFANRPQEIMPPGGFDTRTTNFIPVNAGGPQTVYFRVPFSFPGNPANAQLRLIGVVDDGLVAYINGQEAGRIRITNDAPVSFTAFATAASPEATEVHGMNEVVLSTSALVEGNNLLAVQLHQNNMTSSDVAFSIQLIGEIAEFSETCPPLSIVRDAGTGQVTISWTGGAGCTLQETDALAGASTVWVPSARLNGVPFTPPAGNKFYRLAK